MTRPRSYEECLADRQTIRKRGGTSRALPADLEPARQAFETGIVKSLTANDPASTLEAAVNEAVSQIVAKVFRDAMADVTARESSPTPEGRTRQEDHAMDATTWIAKSGTEIEAAAMDWVARTGAKVNGAEAVARYLETPSGKRAYAAYLKEQEGVAKRYAQSRLDPPPEVVESLRKSGGWPR